MAFDTGDLARLFHLLPNWKTSYEITYAFKTSLNTSRSGKEQRRAQRQTPRKTLAYTALAKDDQLRALKRNLWAWQPKVYVIPELTRYVESTQAMAIGARTIRVASVPPWMLVETPVVLEYHGDLELRVIESIDGDLVTFKTAGTSPWPVGTRVNHGLTGSLDPSLNVNRQTNTVAEIQVSFTVEPVSEPYIEPPAAEVTFNGREVFLQRPNWASPPQVTSAHDVQTVDYDRGPVARFVPVDFGYETRQATFLGRTPEQAQLLLDLFYRMRGMQGEFYMPTFEPDFMIRGTTPAGSASLRVIGAETATDYDDTVHKAVCLVMRDGTYRFRKVLSMAKVEDDIGSDTLMTVDAAWDAPISGDTVLIPCWMPVWRFASDELTVEWLTRQVAQVQMSHRTLEDLAPEAP